MPSKHLTTKALDSSASTSSNSVKKNRGYHFELILISDLLVLTGLGDKLKDSEFDDLRQFMEISPSGQVSYERKLKCY